MTKKKKGQLSEYERDLLEIENGVSLEDSLDVLGAYLKTWCSSNEGRLFFKYFGLILYKKFKETEEPFVKETLKAFLEMVKLKQKTVSTEGAAINSEQLNEQLETLKSELEAHKEEIDKVTAVRRFVQTHQEQRVSQKDIETILNTAEDYLLPAYRRIRSETF
ncbi:hypothetical protein DID77_02055 [Candidatus Marinamargulisbacteria bacterium SCGC AG-439-L15]|nr:hypothetical protein DID77_02055 [Candidatus Marinamargulisbacteria bacterium SCGC AG-439-L15]